MSSVFRVLRQSRFRGYIMQYCVLMISCFLTQLHLHFSNLLNKLVNGIYDNICKCIPFNIINNWQHWPLMFLTRANSFCIKIANEWRNITILNASTAVIFHHLYTAETALISFIHFFSPSLVIHSKIFLCYQFILQKYLGLNVLY